LSGPFDETRYRGLLEGLEAVEIPYSGLNAELRYEAEYHRKKFLIEDSERSRYTNFSLGEIAFITDGQHGYHEVDDSSGICMLTAKNAKTWFSDKEGADHIAKWVDDNNKRSSLAENDLILSTRGTVGLCALVVQDVLPANIDQDVARIALNKAGVFQPAFVLAYLNSCFGQDYMLRNASGMVQQGLSLEKVRNIPVPLLSADFQSAIAEVIQQAYSSRKDSFALYAKAETTLLAELGLLGWQPPESLSYQRKASEAFLAGRLDAEHFQPKYNALFSLLAAKGDVRLGDCVIEPIRRGISPDYVEDGGDLRVINSKHVGKTHVELEDNRFVLRESLFSEQSDNAGQVPKGMVRQGDVLLNSTGMITIGRCQCLLDETSAVVDNHVAIIRPTAEVDPVYLACFLNSLPG
jgi:hypothetical protein